MSEVQQRPRQESPGGGTGPFVGNDPGGGFGALAEPRPSAPDPAVELRKRLSKQWGPETAERLALLGIVLGKLDGVAFEDSAHLLGVKETRLERFMRGDEQIPATYVSRWQMVAEILENLHSVIKPAATGKWLNTAIPRLGNRTPLVVASEGGLSRLREATEQYRDASFS